jgi:hypothetical protein
MGRRRYCQLPELFTDFESTLRGGAEMLLAICDLFFGMYIQEDLPELEDDEDDYSDEEQIDEVNEGQSEETPSMQENNHKNESQDSQVIQNAAVKNETHTDPLIQPNRIEAAELQVDSIFRQKADDDGSQQVEELTTHLSRATIGAVETQA